MHGSTGGRRSRSRVGSAARTIRRPELCFPARGKDSASERDRTWCVVHRCTALRVEGDQDLESAAPPGRFVVLNSASQRVGKTPHPNEIGPGAWSIDARLYGWKEIKISSRQRRPDDSSS